MRIALLSTPFVRVPPKGYGGTELVVSELARGLAAAGHEVTLFATGDSVWDDVRYVFEEPRWPPDPRDDLVHCGAAAREIAAERYDVVHAHSPAALAFDGQYRAPLVYTLHHARDGALSRLYAERRRVTLVAISARQRALEPAAAGCDVVHHGLDPDSFPLGLGDGGHALFLGRLDHSKGPDLAIEAARRAGTPIAVAGRPHRDADDPPGWPERLSAALRSPGVAWVEEAGALEKRALLAGARALLVPLRWEEPFGLVMIEAMLSGCPVVAFPRGAAPEIVEPGVTGWLVRDPAEMADALLAAGSLDRRACRDRARQRFSARRMVDDYLAIYRRVAAAWPRTAAPADNMGLAP